MSNNAKCSIFDVEMVLTLAIADIMRLVGQDFVDLETYDPPGKLRRLDTCAVDRSERAAAPLFIEDDSFEEG